MTLRNGKTINKRTPVMTVAITVATVATVAADTKVEAPIHVDIGEFVKELQTLIIEQHKTRPGCVFDQLDALCDVYRYINQHFPSFSPIEKMSITKLINVINAKIPQHLASLIPLAHRYPDAKEFKKLEDASQILLASANVMQNK